MSDTARPFAFSQFVPGFDFLKSLATGAGKGSGGALPGLSNWVAPTLSIEEVDKRIQELKTVQYWLEQNGHALKATIQALEVQKMTLSTLRGMNVRMEDIASAFTRTAAPAAAPEPTPVPEAANGGPVVQEQKAAADAPAAGGEGVVDPLQWWGSLTQQFQQIASSALQDAAQLKMPSVAQPLVDAVGKAMGGSLVASKTVPATKKRAASASRAGAAAKKSPKKSTASPQRPAARKR